MTQNAPSGKRCFDCLAPVPDVDDVLCAKCEAVYAERKRKQ